MYHLKPEVSDEQFIVTPLYIKVSPTSGCYIQATVDEAQGVSVNGTPYSINTDNPISNIETAVLTAQADWDEETQAKYTAKLCAEAKAIKIPQLSQACNEAIYAGAQIELGETPETFSYTLDDQANISEMTNAVVLGAEAYPYHANGANCRMYQSPEIVTMYSTLSSLKTHHLTYYNQLRAYVNSLTTAEDVYAVEYGQELTGEYLAKYNELMTQAQVEMEKVLTTMSKSGLTANAE